MKREVTPQNTTTALRAGGKQMAKVFYSVELESNSYMDDIINGTLEECREWCKNHGYSNADGRIAEITDDGDPLVTAFYEIED
ncbi:MAG: hypothetical protein [Bacteriophage sp.]|jgi:hypothetical protein|nr:MAG: hypothetical protein [Bacteriophage sp.]